MTLSMGIARSSSAMFSRMERLKVEEHVLLKDDADLASRPG
jgi:hypothetical protein